MGRRFGYQDTDAPHLDVRLGTDGQRPHDHTADHAEQRAPGDTLLGGMAPVASRSRHVVIASAMRKFALAV
jgi:hypothetical protein